MAPSLDEAASVYGLIAEAARYLADFSWVSFRFRAGAKWHDGRPISPEDVLFSLNAFRTSIVGVLPACRACGEDPQIDRFSITRTR